MFGFINLDKPAGFTSHDCVAKLRRLLNTKKIGHGGTLDPAATGVLPIAVGKATRLLQFLPETKAYRARIRLGMTTTTDDLEGEVVATTSTSNLDEKTIKASLTNFVGTIEQVPPIYSAIKRDGKKLYELARKGEIVDVPPRTVAIEKIELITWDLAAEFPEVEVNIICSPGTYIRAIARDLGKILGMGGTLASLIRTESCGMRLETSLTFADLGQQLQHNTFKAIAPEQILTHLSSVILERLEAKKWCQGQAIAISVDRLILRRSNNYIATYDEERNFLGISNLVENGSFTVKPKVCIYNPSTE
ncbi:tRNA pseudouridine(55) synthase TruB [Myxosarcina sp. GI1]|uniref:tRNA pseudouridine(55) synthase TruB n=1 Tax=Myxosarcina sp. GI1 TaxID=1541065 RepID=UPI00055A9A0B|nr:tRNA pseudouridine(55) synthase TruB [Myxosarcina sp. GI1]